MDLYRTRIFPALMNRSLDREPIRDLRRSLLSAASGRVIEIGFGTGLNLPFYTQSVASITACEPNTGMAAQQKIAVSLSTIPVTIIPEFFSPALFEPQSFDTAVSTFTLCSVPDAPECIRDLHTLLRPGGKLLLIEHGLSRNPAEAFVQKIYDPLQRPFSDGCRITKDFSLMVEQGGFTVTDGRYGVCRALPPLTRTIYIIKAERR